MAPGKTTYVLGVDPGRQKCGLAVLTSEGICVARSVVPSEQFEESLGSAVRHYCPSAVVLGNRTAAGEVRKCLERVLGTGDQAVPIHMVEEHLSSEEGRRNYLLSNRRGLRRFIPLGLQWPPEPYDDYVAEVLVRRYLGATRR